MAGLPHFKNTWNNDYVNPTEGEYYKIHAVGSNGVIGKCLGSDGGRTEPYKYEFEINGETYIEEYTIYNISNLTDKERAKFLREKALKDLDI